MKIYVHLFSHYHLLSLGKTFKREMRPMHYGFILTVFKTPASRTKASDLFRPFAFTLPQEFSEGIWLKRDVTGKRLT